MYSVYAACKCTLWQEFLHKSNHTHGWWTGCFFYFYLFNFLSLESRLAQCLWQKAMHHSNIKCHCVASENGITPRTRGVTLSTCEQWTVWEVECIRAVREVLWDCSSLPLKKHQGRRTNSAQSMKSLSVDKANVKRISLWEHLVYQVPPSGFAPPHRLYLPAPHCFARLCPACLDCYSEINANA